MNSLGVRRTRALTFLGFGYLAYAFVSYQAQWNIPVCVFRLVTGLPCPLCGLTRSVGAALSGQVMTALRFHILGPAVVLANVAVGILLFFMREDRRGDSERAG